MPACYCTHVWPHCAPTQLNSKLNVSTLHVLQLAVTLVSWGSSTSDISANLAMARDGFPTMALTACFGSPLLTLLGGLTCTLFYVEESGGSGGGGSTAVALPGSTSIRVLYACSLACSLAWAIVIPLVFRYGATHSLRPSFPNPLSAPSPPSRWSSFTGSPAVSIHPASSSLAPPPHGQTCHPACTQVQTHPLDRGDGLRHVHRLCGRVPDHGALMLVAKLVTQFQGSAYPRAMLRKAHPSRSPGADTDGLIRYYSGGVLAHCAKLSPQQQSCAHAGYRGKYWQSHLSGRPSGEGILVWGVSFRRLYSMMGDCPRPP